MPLPSWGASSGGQHSAPKYGGGDPLGVTFQPPSCDTVLREHYWFWQPNTEQSLRCELLPDLFCILYMNRTLFERRSRN